MFMTVLSPLGTLSNLVRKIGITPFHNKSSWTLKRRAAIENKEAILSVSTSACLGHAAVSDTYTVHRRYKSTELCSSFKPEGVCCSSLRIVCLF